MAIIGKIVTESRRQFIVKYSIVISAAVFVISLAVCVAALFFPTHRSEFRGVEVSAWSANYIAGDENCASSALNNLKGNQKKLRVSQCELAVHDRKMEYANYINSSLQTKAALESAYYSLNQTQIGAASLALGIITMIAAVAASIYAAFAAQHSKRSADVAQETLRPWLSFKLSSDVSIQDPGGDEMHAGVNALSSVENHGHYPAINARIFYFLATPPWSSEQVFDEMIDRCAHEKTLRSINVFPGRTVDFGDNVWTQTDTKYDENNKRDSDGVSQSQLYLFCLVLYSGPFGGNYHSGEAYRLDFKSQIEKRWRTFRAVPAINTSKYR